jgi:hypothetical protein
VRLIGVSGSAVVGVEFLWLVGSSSGLACGGEYWVEVPGRRAHPGGEWRRGGDGTAEEGYGSDRHRRWSRGARCDTRCNGPHHNGGAPEGLDGAAMPAATAGRGRRREKGIRFRDTVVINH